MAVSAGSMAVLLALPGSFVDFVADISAPGIDSGEPLTIRLQQVAAERKPDVPVDDQAVPSLAQEDTAAPDGADLPQEVATASSRTPPAPAKPVRDWHAIAQEAAKASVDDYVRNEESRASLWRQSRTVMFQPARDFVVKEDLPVIADFQFRPEIHVVGLGITIGSCFIGIPLAGVPVEQRTVAISLFVCASDSG